MSQDFYQQTQGYDLRDELAEMLHGGYQTVPIGRPVILRKISDTHCACWNELTGSPDPSCRACQGEGYQFTETMETAYIARNFGSPLGASTVIQQQNALSPVGYTDSNRAIAYLEYFVFPNYERYTRSENPAQDSLYEVKVNDSGEPVYPIVRTAKWKIASVTPHHGDWGRVELFECGLQKTNL
jgi:hypothetical protein